jgi:hypothetical protein
VSIVFYVAYASLLLLAANHLVQARRGLRTGIVDGLVIGYWGKRFKRSSEPAAFWLNVSAGLFVAAVGAVAILWVVLVIAMSLTNAPL